MDFLEGNQGFSCIYNVLGEKDQTSVIRSLDFPESNRPGINLIELFLIQIVHRITWVETCIGNQGSLYDT